VTHVVRFHRQREVAAPADVGLPEVELGLLQVQSRVGQLVDVSGVVVVQVGDDGVGDVGWRQAD
jgi:hypothetical protein